MLSVFYYCILALNDREQFKRCFLIYLHPPDYVPKLKVGKSPAHESRLCEYI